MKVSCYIGLGSNLDNPQQQVMQAFSDLANIDATETDAFSSLYLSDPMGPADQPRYVNAVARLSTTLAPMQLLKELQRIENEHDRVRSEQRWSARTLDLDLLLFGDQMINTDELVVPHPGIVFRSFVLLPLLEIDTTVRIPGLGAAKDYVDSTLDYNISKLDSV